MTNSIDHITQIETHLQMCELEISASEVHGIIVGAIANHLKSGKSPDLLGLIEPNIDAKDERYSQFVDILYEIYRESSELLLAGTQGFDLFLPDEDESLETRVDGLAGWCKGYILGLLYNNAFSVDQMPGSGPEIVRDIMQIAEASSGADQEIEEDWALAELQEYIKVGAQLIFEFIYSQSVDEEPAPDL